MNIFIPKKIIIFIIYLLSTSTVYSIDVPNIDNLMIHKDTIKLSKDIRFKDENGDIISLSGYKNKLIILNFWATWCAPCKKEMPSLDNLQSNSGFKNLIVIPVNVGKENISRSIQFYKKLDIKNLGIFVDETNNLANLLLLRGIPTTILINKNGDEFARILGAIDFENPSLIKWLTNFD